MRTSFAPAGPRDNNLPQRRGVIKQKNGFFSAPSAVKIALSDRPDLPRPALDQAEVPLLDDADLVAQPGGLLEFEVARVVVHLLLEAIEQFGQGVRRHGRVF